MNGEVQVAYHGFEAIRDRWMPNLELTKVILELADDMSGAYQNRTEFDMKYSERRRPHN